MYSSICTSRDGRIVAGIIVGQHHDRLDVGVRISHDRFGQVFLVIEIDFCFYFVLLELRLQDIDDFISRLRIQERNLSIEPARALDVDIQLIRTIRHQYE
jgi:hypothetical protein